jgi:hypothetical protein
VELKRFQVGHSPGFFLFSNLFLRLIFRLDHPKYLKADACEPLIEWLHSTCNLRPDYQASAVQRDAPTVPLVDPILQARRLELMRQDLPGRFLPPVANVGDSPLAATMGDFTHEYREENASEIVWRKHYEAPSCRTGYYCH